MKKIVIIALMTLSVPTFAYVVDRVEQFDTDKDGKVSLEEYAAKCNIKALFRLADKDKDGFLTNVEMRAGREYLFKKCDK